ncbi:hypothetical protein QFZ22_007201 [Streptomyces canus]|uniref:Uncharacterized protein n=1 Tax=Streptomyces canus TaxID=58343 RepID=A0AAW8FQB3_9ACTN|nr:hypothetical protein [Streptomyces canus]MDQ0911216.1 hypothetical protein [Streptomyces canus]
MINDAHWTDNLFGDLEPDNVQRRISQALQDMNDNARRAQGDANSRRKHTYGITRYNNSHERLQEQFDGVEGAYRINAGKSFNWDLIVVGKALLYPFHYAHQHKDVREAKIPNVHQGIVNLFQFAPPPTPIVDIFGDEHMPGYGPVEHGRLYGLPRDTRLVLVPFASNDSGLLKAYWGIAALVDETGALEWTTTPEPLPVASSTRPTLDIVQRHGAASEVVTFDSGDAPVAELSPRPDEAGEAGGPTRP